ncbi:pseudouridine synthase [Xylariaceae sp. FL1272]|nr:pseudouridine synthase [Xylariaceae sp. FL1272]
MKPAARLLKKAASGAASRPWIMDGVFAINKPVGMSSAQVIRDVQHHFNPSALFKPMIDNEIAMREQESNRSRKKRRFGDIRVKMGHGGTLDPLASGVLVLGVGKGTKQLQGFIDCTKSYETVVLFGASTDTYDRVGKILKKTGYDHITRPMVEEALNGFRGTFQQVPPLYSALKMEGKPLYEYAREGKPIPREIATREVTVTELEMVEWYEPGTHNHRWPAEEATTFERSFAEQVWKVEKDQTTNPKLTPEEEEADSKARDEHENFKRKADESVDALVYDRSSKRKKKNNNHREPPMMSGALGTMPPQPGKGSSLIPEAPDADTPPPWSDKGPPAARIRMTVTSGFYVRSFCHDLGTKVASSACMAELCRSRQRDFVLGSTDCLEYSDLAKGEEVWGPRVQKMISRWKSQNPQNPQAANRAKMNVRPSDGDPTRRLREDLKDIEQKDDETPRKSRSRSPPKDQNSPKRGSSPVRTKEMNEESWNGFADAPKEALGRA